MQLVVEISEDTFFDLKKKQNRTEVDNAVLNGTPLDKIRAEIMKLQTYKMFGGEDTVYVEHEDVLQIIDKYKAESEVQDADSN